MASQEIRVRFAPSPTGALHLGGARTAIYNWLFARRNGGKFLLRIEDTDIERSDIEYVNQICDSLHWLGLSWDEEPIYQSQRLDIYKQKVQELLEKGSAYLCFCSPEELEAERLEAEKNKKPYRYSKKCRNLSPQTVQKFLEEGKPYAVRFKMPEGVTSWDDLVFGTISVNNNEIDDFIIQRSTGIPVYQLAVVVDDIAMGITHIIRGEDHIPNTPKQINIWRAFGVREPIFAHLPLLLGTDGKRLSKRHGATGVDEYREMGFPSRAVFNYLALLGWAPKDGREILNVEDIVAQFELTAISKKAAVFDLKKLEFISGEHINLMSVEEIRAELLPRLRKNGFIKEELSDKEIKYIDQVISLMKSRVKTFQHFIDWGSYFFKDPEAYEEKGVQKYWLQPDTQNRMQILSGELSHLEEFSALNIEQCLRSLADKMGIKAADLIHPLRLALTGFTISPGIFEVAELLGKDTVIRRINKAIRSINI